jgi:hypothetical protein
MNNFAKSFFLTFSRNFDFALPFAAVAATLSGCGTIPDAKVNYFYTQSKVAFKAVRSVACDSGDHLIAMTTVTPSVVNSASNTPAGTLDLTKLRGFFSDADVKFDFYEDGRLKDMNATSTGQGDTILKAATTLATSLAAFVAGQPPPTYPTQCQYIKSQGGGKPLSLTYAGDIDFSKGTAPQEIKADAVSSYDASQLAGVIGGVCAVVKSKGQQALPIDYTPKSDDVTINVRQPGWAQIVVSRSVPGGGCPETDAYWNDRVAVAQFGTAYSLPVPKPAIFGKSAVSFAFADSGALTTAQFTSVNGTAQALSGLDSLLTIAQGESTASKAADVKAQADLIAQQQRLVQCLADHAICK